MSGINHTNDPWQVAPFFEFSHVGSCLLKAWSLDFVLNTILIAFTTSRNTFDTVDKPIAKNLETISKGAP